MLKQSVNIRDEFHISEVHGSKNATGSVQSQRDGLRAPFTLHVTCCVYTSMNLRKMKFIP